MAELNIARDNEINLSTYDPTYYDYFISENADVNYISINGSWIEQISGGSGVSNGVIVASPGSLQSSIDQASTNGGGIVLMVSGGEYDPGTEINLKKDVTLDFNGAKIVQTTDHDTIFMDHGSKILNGWIDCTGIGATATSTILRLDSDRAGNTSPGSGYSNAGGKRTAVTIDCYLEGPEATSTVTGLELNAGTTTGSAITIDNNINVTVRECGTGIHADVPAGRFVNLDPIYVQLVGNGTAIRHTGADPFNSTLYGLIQPENDAQYGIRNESGASSCIFIGQFWDTSNYAVSAVTDRTSVVQYQANASNLVGNNDGTGGYVESIRNGTHQVYDASDDSYYELSYDSGNITFNKDGSTEFQVGGFYKHNLRSNPISFLLDRSDAGSASLKNEEFAVDSDRDGTNVRSLIYQDSGGVVNQWDAPLDVYETNGTPVSVTGGSYTLDTTVTDVNAEFNVKGMGIATEDVINLGVKYKAPETTGDTHKIIFEEIDTTVGAFDLNYTVERVK